jgi:hypothetical protein
MRPNAPKMITVVIAVALTIVGLSLTVLPIDPVTDVLREVGLRLTKEQRWLVLAASPVLLIIASFVPGL